MEGKLDALVNSVTQLVRIEACLSLQESGASKSGVDEHPEAYAANTYSRPPQRRETRHLIEKMAPNSWRVQSARNDVIVIRGVHDMARDASREDRKLEGKQDALVNLVTPASCE
ncbi:hypothetical protein Fmac_015326 [Flemingia macrophylla]|uniref:BON domain-containing protein n=1 Tax=Flemingia macrophylla TaxID=520843 RepID=A0ABD1MF53_9FABA